MIARSTALTEILCGWQSPQYFFYPASFLAVKTPIRHSSAVKPQRHSSFSRLTENSSVP
jgi:hypothetical protein